MANDYTSEELQYILNSTPLSEWQQDYGLSEKAIGLVGGLQLKNGRFQWNVKTSGNTVASYTGSEAAGAGVNIGKDQITARPQRYRAVIPVDEVDQMFSEAGGVSEISDLTSFELNQTVMDMLDKINTGIFEAEGDYAVTSLGTAIHSESGDYYDKARSSFEYASCPCVSSSAQLEISDLDTLHMKIKKENKANYDLIVMSIGNAKRYEKLLGAGSGSVKFAGTKDISIGDATFAGALQYEGTSIVSNGQCPDDEVYFINQRDLKFWIMPNKLVYAGDTSVGPFKVSLKAANGGDVAYYVIKIKGNLIMLNTNRNGKIYGLLAP